MKPMSFSELRAFYEDQLFNDILRFWMNRGIDREYGAFLTCFNNAGDKLLKTHKYVWSQGRFVWMLSRLARTFKGRRSDAQTSSWLAAARSGAEFLMKNARLPDGTCSFILSREGQPILVDPDGTERKAGPGESYHTSIAGDCFMQYGLAEYAIAANDRKAYAFAADLYDSIISRRDKPARQGGPYPIPTGFKTHSGPMMAVEMAHQQALAAEHFGDPRKDEHLKAGADAAARVLDEFRNEDNVVIEFKSDDPAKSQSMLGQYINPGHTLECMWFIVNLAQKLGRKDLIQRTLPVMLASCRVGWDEEFGGLCQFVHRTGGAPRGPVPAELEGAEMIHKLRNNWDNKLWWPHSEALYALLLGYYHSRDQVFMDWYWRAHEYAYKTFPNPDRSVGEWIQIRDRQGKPVDKVVALPVKDPFHITRVYVWCIDVLDKMAQPAK